MTESSFDRVPGSLPSAVPPPPPPPSSLDDLRSSLVLQREADAMVAEALETKRSAVERAESLVREAEQAAARAQEEAAAAAERRIAAAREEAARVVAAAEDEALRITGAARAEIGTLRADAAELRDSARATLEAAEEEWQRARLADEERERRLSATHAEAVGLVEHLERVGTTLEGLLAQVRAEADAARHHLARLGGDLPAAEVPAPSVVIQWPHGPVAADAGPAAEGTGDTVDTTSSKHRADDGSRRGRLRRARP